MKKQHLIIIIGILLIGLLTGIWQYIETFKAVNVSAVTVGIPNPGHAWDSMECSANSLCLDTVNNRLGIGTNTPATTLDVKGTITASEDICTSSICLNSLVFGGMCGSADGGVYAYAPTANLCAQGTASAVSSSSGVYSWTCSGMGGGTSASCHTASCPSNATCSTTGSDYVIKWSTVGSYSWNPPSNIFSVQYLVVGGGGGGGSYHAGGGGGAGGFRTNFGGTSLAVNPEDSISVVVGAGGAGGTSGGVGGFNGSDSSFASVVAAGGGRGGNGAAGSCGSGLLPGDGGSGGGACGVNSATTIGLGNTPALSPVQGYNGGTGDGSWVGTGGGGGGAGGPGANATAGAGGNGGVGLSSSITGSAVMYAGGGGGGYRCDGGSAGIGGDGGGGSGLSTPTSGEDGKGGGGGGSGYYCASREAGKGGSGVVIVRFTMPNQ